MSGFPPPASMNPPTPTEALRLHEAHGYRGRPQAPRSPRMQSGSLEVNIFWNAPQDDTGIRGYRVYQSTEDNKLWESHDRLARKANIKVPADSKFLFFISSFTDFDLESAKIPVLGNSNTDKMVVDGTTGETGGVQPLPPPEWFEEPTGGKQQAL